MKAREIIAAELFWPFEIVYGDPSEAANDYAARIVSQLAKAGFVILPKEPSEGMIEAGRQAIRGSRACLYSEQAVTCYADMISHAEWEKG